MQKHLCLFIAFLCMSIAQAQVDSTQTFIEKKYFKLTSDTLQLDSHSIACSSIEITPNLAFECFGLKGYIVLKNREQVDSVQITYRTLNFDFNQPYFHKDTQRYITPLKSNQNPFSYLPGETNNNNALYSRLTKSGSLSRGINFGNSQNVGVQSNLNLQLSGYLSDEIQINAAISDANIPVQPEGNTQQLQDFDRVFIQVFNNEHQLTGGDFAIQENNAHFLTYQKKLRGVGYAGNYNLDNGWSGNTTLSAAVSRGKFARNTIQGEEGNQGPYRLYGNENEQYIILLSGTERVYVDGRLLKRGQAEDYVVDYNTAEITFTPKNVITKDRRIVVEFQYSSQAWNRSLTEIGQSFSKDNSTVYFKYYNEKDNKNAPLQQDLNNERLQILVDAGDDPSKAVVSGAILPNQDYLGNLYRVDSLGPTDSIFVYSTNQDSLLYQVQFTYVGPNQGQYQITNSNANGRIYTYFPDQNGERQGDYAPVTVLISPKKRSMLILGAKTKIANKLNIQTEYASTQTDLNTLSELDNEDNQGNGIFVNSDYEIINDSAVHLAILGGLEWRDNDFNPIERYRAVEFNRDWNITTDTLAGTQNIVKGGVAFSHQNLGIKNTEYTTEWYTIGNEYQGLKQNLNVKLSRKKINATYNGNYLSTEQKNIGTTEFYRHRSKIEMPFKKIILGYEDYLENNQKSTFNTDSLNNQSYSFWEQNVYLRSNLKGNWEYKIGYNHRTDNAPIKSEFDKGTEAHAANAELNWQNGSNQWGIMGTYRTLSVLDTTFYAGDPEKNLTGRFQYSLRLWKGFVQLSSFYEIGSGLQQKQEFVYVEVPSGTGYFQWTDYNGDGVEDLDEFEVASFPDQANYIRVNIPTNEYISTYSTAFNQSLLILPAARWNNKKGVKKLLSKFSDQFIYNVVQKEEKQDGIPPNFNPFNLDVERFNLVQMNANVANNLYFNRTSRKFGAQHEYRIINGAVSNLNGVSTTAQNFQTINFRYNPLPIFQIDFKTTWGNKLSDATWTDTRDYNIDRNSYEPKFTYQPNTQFNVNAFYNYSLQQNTPDLGGEKTIASEWGLETRLNQSTKGTLQASIKWVEIDFSGDLTYSPVAFEMMDGLQPGQNLVWEMSYQSLIAKLMQINLLYSGRKNENSNTIHTGSVQVRINF